MNNKEAVSPIEMSPTAKAYLEEIGAEMKTLFRATVEIKEGKYDKEYFSIVWDREGKCTCRGQAKGHVRLPTVTELEAFKLEIPEIHFPKQTTIAALSPANNPSLINNAADQDLFIYRNQDGDITFVQVRIDYEDRDKRYVPLTYWDDGQWRTIEPEDYLPVYNLENVRSQDKVFLHEGAKAARAAERIKDDPTHPFHTAYMSGIHVGWIGGAHYLHRTDFSGVSQLASTVIIVVDNDDAGRSNVGRIAKNFHCETYMVSFDDMWPEGWDCADPIPEHFYVENKDEQRYVGPSIPDMMFPAVWATEEFYIEDDKKPKYRIRKAFANQWFFVAETEQYFSSSNPEFGMSKAQFNAVVRCMSDVADTAGVFNKESGRQLTKLTFRPDRPKMIRVTEDKQQAFNQYVDHRVAPKQGTYEDTRIFWEYMEYLFPEENERLVAKRWIATLYSRPDMRMGFGILLISEQQGTGKSTFLRICEKLIGSPHTAKPGGPDIESSFNSWVVNKRLVAMDEVYAGQSWNSYNKFKSLVTDEWVTINTKNVKEYKTRNWVQFLLASNSREALKIEDKDRRWFIPTITEKINNPEFYDELQQWIVGGGPSYLAHELLKVNDHITESEKPPETEAKNALKHQSISGGQHMVYDCLEALGKTKCVDVSEIVNEIQNRSKDARYLKNHHIQTIAMELGMHVIQAGRKTYVWKSQSHAEEVMQGIEEDMLEGVCKKNLQPYSDLIGEQKAM